MWLLLMFVAVPIIEIGLFIEIGGIMGTWATLAVVVGTAIAGTLLIRVQGRATIDGLKESLSSGKNPAFLMAHGALILVAGVLLLTPGFFTDTVGLLLMIPPVRAAIIRWGTARAQVKMYAAAANNPGPPRGDSIDGEFEILDEDTTPGNSNWTKRP